MAMEQTCTTESHDEAKTTPTAWATYRLVGCMRVDCPEPYTLELRNCPHCHSTLAVEVAEKT